MRRFRILGVVTTVVISLASASYADKGQVGNTGTAPATPASPASASEPVAPLQLALVPTIQLVPQDQSIRGLRLNIYGENQNMSGVDVGLMHETKDRFSGVAFGLLNTVHGEARGLQLSGIYSGADAGMSGLQVGIVNRSGNIHGLQIGVANFADDMTGIQIGLWNEIKSKENWSVVPIINAAF
ncbi:MAG TPA: hypothetical protein VL486_12455 [Verrucomicrobiae bacterium]|nr:hypothetical protein [Verrucomicrobiae bacterium]